MKKALGLSTLLLSLMSASTFAATSAQADVVVQEDVDQITCGEFVELDDEVMPITVGYLYAVNADGTDVDVIEVQDLVNVEIASIVDECSVTPEAKVVDVIDTQVSEKAKVANNVETAM
ncbi:hypothetical protein VIN01S_24150 [Vibrio inusitatus NBRC 102082]|uniref:Uncharacterized protein n=1 Tax=Vibrio inusitatus NBRC 102082 TaxID=1219070 RepID=A0A4Y3HXB4_9VIBR|nr:HdeA/HdeB family chaperone [Vibrio inusitatus]GEA51611.1 hypothetical protein VIN01S_24150 [Vibrio inusitatus NBRC 102082]